MLGERDDGARCQFGLGGELPRRRGHAMSDKTRGNSGVNSNSFLLRARLEHRNSTGNSRDRIFGGKNSFEPFGT